MQIFGGLGASSDAKAASRISKNIAGHEQDINNVKQRQMELEGRRMQLENIRNNQRARAMSENAAVNQGAQFGSGLQGGLAEIQNQSLFNMFGVNKAIQAGLEINQFNQAISKEKMQLADVQASSANNQAIASLGGSVMKAGPIIGQLAQGFGGNNGFNFMFGGGSPSGYGK